MTRKDVERLENDHDHLPDIANFDAEASEDDLGHPIFTNFVEMMSLPVLKLIEPVKVWRGLRQSK